MHSATDLRVLNPAAAPADVTLEFLPLAGESPAPPVKFSVPAGALQVYQNVLASQFSLNERSGALRITSAQGILVAARTYVDSAAPAVPATNVDAVAYEDLLTPGSAGETISAAQTADPATGFATNIGVVLVSPASSVDVAVFDPVGHKLGGTTVSGAAQLVLVPLSTLATGDVPVARVVFTVWAGRAAAFVDVTDKTTGDRILARAPRRPNGALAAVVDPVIRSTTPDGRLIRNDLRLLNLSANSTTITVSALSPSDGATPPDATLTLASGETREVQDVLATLFGIADSATAGLRLSGPDPVVAVSRTLAVNSDGTVNGLGGFQNAANSSAFLGSNGGGVLLGMNPTANVELLAGADGASVVFNVFDATGAPLATSDPPLTLSPRQAMEVPLAQVFSGVDFTAETIVQVQNSLGELLARGASNDAATAQPVYGDSGIPPATGCPAVMVSGFEAAPSSLSAAGQVELTWATGGADFVQISPGPTAQQPANASLTVNVTARTVYQLTATGPCGTATASLEVPFGAATLVSVTPSSAAPGQQVTLKVSNLAPTATTLGALLTVGDSTFHLPIDRANSAAEFLVTIPFITTDGDTGYVSGTGTIAADLAGSATASAAFTVKSLPVPTNSATTFRTFLNTVVTAALSALDRQKAVASATSGPDIDALKSLVNGYASNLRSALDGVNSSGTATLVTDIPSTTNPNPATVTITRQDIDTLVGFLSQRPGALNGPSFKLPATPPAATSNWPCLSDDPIYAACAPAFYFSQLAAQAQGLIRGILAITPGGNLVKKTGLHTFLMQYLDMIQKPGLLCNLYPLQLNGFLAQPNPDPLPQDEDRAYPVAIKANLQPFFTPDQAADYLNNLMLDSTMSFYKEVFYKFPSTQQAALLGQIRNEYTSLLQTARPEIVKAVNNDKEFIGKALARQVYECDITNVASQTPDRLRRLSPLNAGDVAPPFYPFQGLESGRAQISVQTRSGSFYVFQADGSRVIDGTSRCCFLADVNVDNGYSVTVVSSTRGVHGANSQVVDSPNWQLGFGNPYLKSLGGNDLDVEIQAYQNLKQRKWTIYQRTSGDQASHSATPRENGAVNIISVSVQSQAVNGVQIGISSNWSLTGGNAPPNTGRMNLSVSASANGASPSSYSDTGIAFDGNSQSGNKSFTSANATFGKFDGTILGQGFNENGIMTTTIQITSCSDQKPPSCAVPGTK